jgi:hypothetical protein
LSVRDLCVVKREMGGPDSWKQNLSLGLGWIHEVSIFFWKCVHGRCGHTFVIWDSSSLWRPWPFSKL